jgi:adenosine deaminase
MSTHIAGPAAAALASLTPGQLAFIRALPKAELHAHLNGSIPLPTLQSLAREYLANPKNQASDLGDSVRTGVEQLERGVSLDSINDFFGLFSSIYALTSGASGIRAATRGVLEAFLGPGTDGQPECTYLELRTGPRRTEAMTRRMYLEAVLDEVEQFPPERAALIVALDRQMSSEDMGEVVALAAALKAEGRRVVAIDLCGNPLVRLSCYALSSLSDALHRRAA